jgi:ABC-type lipoprotein export system ATPase subunit
VSAQPQVGRREAPREARLQVRGATVRIGDRRVLAGVDLDVPAGALIAVTGPSGAGKSTLLAVAAGLLRPDAGTATLDGEPLAGVQLDHRREALARRVGLVLQGYGLVPVLTAAENVELPLQLRRLPPAEVRDRAHAILERLGVAGAADRLVEELSGGQQQRVAVARALVARPDVLVADEPTAELDRAWREVVLVMLREAAGAGTAVVLATHDEEVAAACDSGLHLVDGTVAETW